MSVYGLVASNELKTDSDVSVDFHSHYFFHTDWESHKVPDGKILSLSPRTAQFIQLPNQSQFEVLQL